MNVKQVGEKPIGNFIMGRSGWQLLTPLIDLNVAPKEMRALMYAMHHPQAHLWSILATTIEAESAQDLVSSLQKTWGIGTYWRHPGID